jgi:hypothetical protein
MSLVHIEAVNADAAGQMMVDQLRPRGRRDVVDAEAAVAIRLRVVLLDGGEIGLGNVQLLQEFGMGRLAAELLAQVLPDRRHVLRATPRRRRIALVIDDHDVAGHAHLVAVRAHVAHRHRGDETRIGRIGNIGNRCAEILLVRNVPDVGVVAGDRHLPRTGQIEMADAADVLGRGSARIVDLTHAESWSRPRFSRSPSISEFRI